METGSGAGSRIVIKRRTVVQDLVRSYTVFIDGKPAGKLWAFQTGRYDVAPGKHTVRLAIVGTGTAASANIEIRTSEQAETVLRTVGRGVANFLKLPLSLPAGVKAQLTGEPIDSRFYKGPWINLQLESNFNEC